MINYGIAACKGGSISDFARSSPARGVCPRVGLKKREAMGVEEEFGAPQPWWDTVCGSEPRLSFFSSFYD